MNLVRVKAFPFRLDRCIRCISNSVSVAASKNGGDRILDYSDTGPPIPEYQPRVNETVEQKKARLFYQSRYSYLVFNDLFC